MANPTNSTSRHSYLLSYISQRLQLDRPLVYALLGKCWQAITGPVTLTLILSALTLPEQGVYYGLVSIVGIQTIFEMGLLNVLISHSGNQSAIISKGNDQSESIAAEHLGVLIHSSRLWFAITSVLFVVVGWSFGWWTLSKVPSTIPWQWPLFVVVPAAALAIALAPALAILEGAGYRESIYRFRLWQMLAGSFAAWLSLLVGLNLWTIVVVTIVQAGFAAYMVYFQHVEFFQRFPFRSHPADGYSWFRDVLPMQWRAALISVAHYLASQTFVLVILGRTALDAADDAGRMGPTLTITGAIQMMALAWVQTKYAVVSAHHGAGDREIAGTLWRQTALISTALLVTALGAFTLLIAALPMLGRNIENNFIQPWQIAVLSAGYVANHLLAVQSFYVMARRANPFWLQSSLGLLITATATWYFGREYSVSGLVISYTVAMCCVTLPLHTWAYYRFRR
jgi:hypothetical protein